MPACSSGGGPHGLPVQPRWRRHQDQASHHPAHEVQFWLRPAHLLPHARGRWRARGVPGGAAGALTPSEPLTCIFVGLPIWHPGLDSPPKAGLGVLTIPLPRCASIEGFHKKLTRI